MTHTTFSRRSALKAAGAASLASTLTACASYSSPSAKTLGHVVVVGGGFGGATAAKYLRMWSQGQIAVTLIEQIGRAHV